jgi:long-chain acyl-CoA synthetase
MRDRQPRDVAQPWQALFPDDSPFELDLGDRHILDLWRDALDARGLAPCLRYFDASLDYATVDRLSTAFAAWLVHRAGARPGHRIVLLLQNTPHFVIALLAIWKAGAIPVPCNPMYRANELAELFADCGPTALIAETHAAATAGEALRLAALGIPVVVADPFDWQTRDDARVLPADTRSDHPDLLTLCLGAHGEMSLPSLAPEDAGLILYTSGTTGRPKGAVISHRSIAFNSVACARWMGIGPASRVLALAPLFHITGFVLHLGVAIDAGCAIALTYRFHPDLVLETIREVRPTFTVAAITAYNALMTCAGIGPADFASFEAAYTGGAPVAPALRDRVRSTLGIELLTAYGMTESCSPTHLSPPGRIVPTDPETGALAVGIPITSTAARICAPDGTPLPAGEAGEVWMRGPQIMTGYWNKPAETAAALTDGWLHSGDIGVMNAEGWLFIVDRQKDMINASGFKVWPRQVEDTLLAHPSIREAAVVGEPDPYRGETVHAFVSLKADAPPPSVEALTAFCRERLAAYKVPKRLTFMDELPKTATGKLQRAELRRALAG